MFISTHKLPGLQQLKALYHRQPICTGLSYFLQLCPDVSLAFPLFS